MLRKTNIFKGLGLIGLSLMLVQCDRIRETIDQYRAKPETRPAPNPNAPPPPPASDFAFDIDLRFDEASVKALNEKKIQVKLTTAYYGTPLEAYRADADESGILSLGHDAVIVGPGDQIIHITPNSLNTARIKDLIDAKPSVIIRASTSQRLEDGRLIDCSIYDNRFEVVRAAPARITCRMFRIGRVQFTPAEEPAEQASSESGED